ncbi:MAG: cold shock domain-containing protein [Chloroflexi bacterium]|nr:cold shock domain-containing protein [Chloroflexota bacterium]
MAKGKIVRLVADRGFGFIRPEGARADIFFHRSAVKGVRFEQLQENQAVEFDAEPDPQNPSRQRAVNITLTAEE